jgi:hypothetical protein
MPDIQNTKAPDPQAGGQYERRADGSLVCVQDTKPAQPRDKREQQADSANEGAPINHDQE